LNDQSSPLQLLRRTGLYTDSNSPGPSALCSFTAQSTIIDPISFTFTAFLLL
jgi:hypothetical protein